MDGMGGTEAAAAAAEADELDRGATRRTGRSSLEAERLRDSSLFSTGSLSAHCTCLPSSLEANAIGAQMPSANIEPMFRAVVCLLQLLQTKRVPCLLWIETML